MAQNKCPNIRICKDNLLISIKRRLSLRGTEYPGGREGQQIITFPSFCYNKKVRRKLKGIRALSYQDCFLMVRGYRSLERSQKARVQVISWGVWLLDSCSGFVVQNCLVSLGPGKVLAQQSTN